MISRTLQGETATIKSGWEREVMLLGRMKNVGGEHFSGHGCRGMDIRRNLPGRTTGRGWGNEGQGAGAAAAQRRAAVATGPTGTRHPGRTATLAGDKAGTNPMTMSAPNRLGRGCGKIS
jgi:hypothetical protein